MIPALALVSLCLPLACGQVVSLFAGSPLGASGSNDGTGTAARFFTPTGLIALPNGLLVVSDFDSGRLRSVNTTDAQVRVFLGPLSNSRPTGLAISPQQTNVLFVADNLGHCILRVLISSAPSLIGIFAGSPIQNQGFINGMGINARFNSPLGLAADSTGVVYVADFENSVIRSITPAGLVATFAGSGAAGSDNGPATSASFWKPSAIAIDETNNKYVCDTWNYLIRLINPAGIVSTLAGQKTKGLVDNVGTNAAFFNPRGITLSPPGLFISDASNNALRSLDLVTLSVTTLAGNGSAGSANGVGRAATFKAPIGSVVVGGNLYLADSGTNTIRRVASLAQGSPSPSASPTVSPTQSPSPTSTTAFAPATPTPTPSQSSSPTCTSTLALLTPTSTPSPSPTSTASPTVGTSPTSSPTASESPTQTPTPTPTPSQTPSTGSSPSTTPPPTSTPTPSPTTLPSGASLSPTPLPSPNGGPSGSGVISKASPPLSSGAIAGIVIVSLALLAIVTAAGAYLLLGRGGFSISSSKGLSWRGRVPAPVSYNPSSVELGSVVKQNPLSLSNPTVDVPLGTPETAATESSPTAAPLPPLPLGWQQGGDGTSTWYIGPDGVSTWEKPV